MIFPFLHFINFQSAIPASSHRESHVDNFLPLTETHPSVRVFENVLLCHSKAIHDEHDEHDDHDDHDGPDDLDDPDDPDDHNNHPSVRVFENVLFCHSKAMRQLLDRKIG